MRSNLPALIFILTAFLMQSLIPAGYMPGTDKDGKAALVVCSIEGQKTVYVDESDIPQKDRTEHTPSQPPCPYAVLALANTAPEPIALYTNNVYTGITYQNTQDASYTQTHQTYYLSRAPPQFIL